MTALLVHLVIFLVIVGAGGVVFSAAVRLVARRMQLPVGRLALRATVHPLLGIAGAGLVGQLLFALFAPALPDRWARLIAWVVVGGLVFWCVRAFTPYMPARRTLFVGALAGVAGWLGFYAGLLVGELAAQLGGLGVLLATLPLAVVFPMPAEVCPCGRPIAHCVRTYWEEYLEPLAPETPNDPSGASPLFPTPGKFAAPGRISVLPQEWHSSKEL